MGKPSLKIASGRRSTEEILNAILDHLQVGKEDYGGAASDAWWHLRYPAEDPSPYRPYVVFFKLFGEAYREWEVGYNYTRTRGIFNLAYHRLEQGLKEHQAKVPNPTLLQPTFQCLTKMVCAYTRCENALITNDPFALNRYAKECSDAETDALNELEKVRTSCASDPVLGSMAKWLTEYIRANQHLHTREEKVADVYIKVLEHSLSDITESRGVLADAEKGLDEFFDSSPARASELNAHLQFARRHLDRLEAGNISYLEVSSGWLVLSLSAACDRKRVRDLIMTDQGRDRLEKAFSDSGKQVDNLHPAKRPDIFETAFGRDNLDTLLVALKDAVTVKFLNDREFVFSVRIHLSAFGVCTVYLSHEISKTRPLTVEKVRALSSLITPHSGQVHITESCPTSVSKRLRNRESASRVSLDGLCQLAGELGMWLANRSKIPQLAPLREAYGAVRKSTERFTNALIESFDQSPTDESWTPVHAAACLEAFADTVDRIGELIRPESKLASKEQLDLREFLENVQRQCRSHYVHDIAREYLDLVANCLQNAGERDHGDDFHRLRNWNLSGDTGWHAYLYATAINLIHPDGQVTFRTPLNQPAAQPDLFGFYLEQREARAAFDDWRFMKDQVILPQENLAYIRSHDTDAFFASEYQAFIYLPNDPMFLTDQYEATVEMMIRLDTVLKNYNELAQALTRRVREDLGLESRGAAKSSLKAGDEEELRKNLDAIRRLRGEAEELRNHVLQARISHYKDHGDLMNRIFAKMKISETTELLQRWLERLDGLQAQILENQQAISEKKNAEDEKSRKSLEALLAALLAAFAVPKIMEVLFKIRGIQAWTEAYVQPRMSSIVESLGKWINRFTPFAWGSSTPAADTEAILTLVVTFVIGGLFYWFKDPPDSKMKKRLKNVLTSPYTLLMWVLSPK